MAQYAFYLDGTRCTGCKCCTFACKDKNDLEVGFAYRKVYEYTYGSTTAAGDGTYSSDCCSYFFSQPCNHCDNPACTAVCPTGAMHKDPDTGLVSVNADVCIGCGYCVMACPYNVPKVDREKGHSTKCDGCIELVKQGRKPVCVLSCPNRAIGFDTVDKIMTMPDVVRLDIAPMPAPSYTNPNSWIKKSPDMKTTGDTTGSLTNPLEVM
jgi:anaerobic dimethyl sulfoxide reductase subunit B (iron-sulfur subunit)